MLSPICCALCASGEWHCSSRPSAALPTGPRPPGFGKVFRGSWVREGGAGGSDRRRRRARRRRVGRVLMKNPSQPFEPRWRGVTRVFAKFGRDGCGGSRSARRARREGRLDRSARIEGKDGGREADAIFEARRVAPVAATAQTQAATVPKMASPARALFLQPHPPEAASAPRRSGARSSVPAALMTKRAPVGGSKDAFESSFFARAPPRPEQVTAPKPRERPDVYSVDVTHRGRERKLGNWYRTNVTVNAYGCELRNTNYHEDGTFV